MTDIAPVDQLADTTQEQPVLVAVDFSEDSKAALRWACNYAALNGAKLVLLHIVHDQASSPGFYKQEKGKQLKPMQAVAEAMMAEFLDEVKSETPGLDILDTAELQFVRGLPPSRIVEVSEILKASLIVMGSRGITGLPHMLLGSVAERVVMLAKLPVVVVKAEDRPESRKKVIKRQQKQQKKDRRRLKELLGLGPKPEPEGDIDG